MRVVRAFDRVKQEEKRFDDANLDLTDVSIRVNRIMAITMPIMMLVLNLSQHRYYLVRQCPYQQPEPCRGVSEVGSLIAFLQYAMLDSVLAPDGFDDVCLCSHVQQLQQPVLTKCWRWSQKLRMLNR